MKNNEEGIKEVFFCWIRNHCPQFIINCFLLILRLLNRINPTEKKFILIYLLSEYSDTNVKVSMSGKDKVTFEFKTLDDIPLELRNNNKKGTVKLVYSEPA